MTITDACGHCGRAITIDPPSQVYIHTEGRNWHLMRCHPMDSNLPYGYNAHPKGTDGTPNGCLCAPLTGAR